jgi:transposase, IS6 family
VPTCDFKGRRFPTGIILVCVRWYCKYGISYRDLEEMTSEGGVSVDHTILFRWVQHYAPLMEKRIRWCQRYADAPWRVDETDAKVYIGKLKYLNNRLDADHVALKRSINPARGFKTMPAASATIKGFEVMRMIRERQCLMLESGAAGEGSTLAVMFGSNSSVKQTPLRQGLPGY